MKKIYLLTFIIGISLLNACKKHDVTESNSIPTFQNYNRQKLLENIGENIIIPAYQAFYDASNNLCTATSNFKTNPTLNTLDSLQWAWKQTESAWKLCELYNFGPASNITAGYYSSIDYHSIDTLAINNCIYSSDKIDSSYIASKGSTIKGLLALEYLLFDRTNGNTAILKKYTPVNYIINQRKDFLFSSAINIKGKAKDLLNAWKSTSGNYIASFISMDGNDINSSLGLLTNQLLYLTDIVN